MRVRITQSIATVTGQLTAGQEYDIDDAEAHRLIDAGQAVDPSGKVAAKAPASRGNPVGKENLDRKPGEPLEKLPSSLNIPGHPFKDPAGSTLTTGTLQPGEPVTGAAAGVAATNAPTAEETQAANERNAPLSENQPGDDKPTGDTAKKGAGKKAK